MLLDAPEDDFSTLPEKWSNFFDARGLHFNNHRQIEDVPAGELRAAKPDLLGDDFGGFLDENGIAAYRFQAGRIRRLSTCGDEIDLAFGEYQLHGTAILGVIAIRHLFRQCA